MNTVIKRLAFILVLGIQSCGIATESFQHLNIEQKNKKLEKAIAFENLLEIKQLIAAGADPNTMRGGKNYCAGTALMVASKLADADFVRTLIKCGANVNIETVWDWPHPGTTALGYAIAAKSLETVKLLIKAGADVNRYKAAQTNILKTRVIPFLSYAIAWGTVEIAQELIKAGADVNMEFGYDKEWTALKVARHLNNQAMIDLLMQSGAQDKQSKNIINCA